MTGQRRRPAPGPAGPAADGGADSAADGAAGDAAPPPESTSAPDPGQDGTPQPGATSAQAHDETGLDLARSIARSLAGRRRTGGKPARRIPRMEPRSSGAHPDDRDPQTLDATLGRLVAEQGWSTEVRVHGVFSRWDALVGRDVAQHVRPVSYVRDDEQGGGRLVVQTDSTAWATQMRLLAATVLRRLNAELGAGTVTLIDVQGPSAPSWKHGRRSVRDGRGPRDTYG